MSPTSAPWPNGLDLAATSIFFLAITLVPALGYAFMVRDFRAYLRSLRRALVFVRSYWADVPDWLRSQTPPCVAALGLRMPCTVDDLKQAYRLQVKRLHPDRGGDKRRFLLLQAHFEQALHHLSSETAPRQPAHAQQV